MKNSTIAPPSREEHEQFERFILTHEEWLMKRILAYADETGFTRYTSTLMEAWRLSIEKLSASLLGLMQLHRDPPELHPDEDYANDPAAEFGVIEAQRHRSRGVNLAMFLGLFKYYRQTYQDLLNLNRDLFPSTDYFLRYIDRFFDRTEIAFCTEWSGLSSEMQIRELSRTNLEMTNEKNKYLTIFDSVASPIAVVDAEGYIENFNFAAEQLWLSEAHPGTRYYREHKVKEKFQWLSREIEEFGAAGESAQSFEKIYQPLGLIFDVKLRKLHDVSKKFIGFTVLMNDITSIKNAEHFKELDRLKTLFIASMSHELRTPLNAIIGFSAVLKQEIAGPLNAKQKEQLERIHSSGEHLLSMIVDVIDISKIESGNLPFIAEEVSLNVLLEELMEEAKPKTEKKGLHLQLAVDTEISLFTDRHRLKQAIGNYLSNAIKFSEKGTVTVRGKEVDGAIEVDVSDEGIGIAQEDFGKLFLPFERLDSPLSVLAGGTGLGLYLTKKIVENLMGGEVHFQSVPGIGSTFGLRIPLKNTAKRDVP